MFGVEEDLHQWENQRAIWALIRDKAGLSETDSKTYLKQIRKQASETIQDLLLIGHCHLVVEHLGFANPTAENDYRILRSSGWNTLRLLR